jgi:hypothetical protein
VVSRVWHGLAMRIAFLFGYPLWESHQLDRGIQRAKPAMQEAKEKNLSSAEVRSALTRAGFEIRLPADGLSAGSKRWYSVGWGMSCQVVVWVRSISAGASRRVRLIAGVLHFREPRLHSWGGGRGWGMNASKRAVGPEAPPGLSWARSCPARAELVGFV